MIGLSTRSFDALWTDPAEQPSDDRAEQCRCGNPSRECFGTLPWFDLFCCDCQMSIPAHDALIPARSSVGASGKVGSVRHDQQFDREAIHEAETDFRESRNVG